MSNVNAPGINQVVTPQSVQTYNAITTLAQATPATTATGNTAVVRMVVGNGNATPSTGTVPYGGLLKRVSVMARATNTACVHYLYRSPDAGTTLFFIAAVTMAAITPSTTAAPASADFGYSDSNALRLEAGDELWVSSTVALTAGFVWDAVVEAY